MKHEKMTKTGLTPKI